MADRSDFALAVLYDADEGGPPGHPGEQVQFNPASLRFVYGASYSPPVNGAKSPPPQQIGANPPTLAMELVFDTADEGRNVREQTECVLKFVRSPSSTDKKVPRVGFLWGAVHIIGVMTSVTEEIDLFRRDGVPLRARLQISITAQDMLTTQVPDTLPPPGAGGLGGGLGLGRSPSVGGGLSVSADLSLGVGVSASLKADAGLGVSAGFEASVGAGATDSFGASGGAGFGSGASARPMSNVSGGGLRAGFSAGGSGVRGGIAGLSASASVSSGAAAGYKSGLPTQSQPPPAATARREQLQGRGPSRPGGAR